MDRETVGNRLSISIYGKRSSGKSRLMNNIIGQEISVVSKVKGTTTDPVSKAMELGELGAVLFTDTAGIDDYGVVGEQRVKKTLGTLQYTDLALYIMDSEDIDEIEYLKLVAKFEQFEIPHILVFNKVDKVSPEILVPFRAKYPEAIFISAKDFEHIAELKLRIIEKLKSAEAELGLLGGLLNPGEEVLMITPIDSGAPKGRLILPQVEMIREVLDRDGIVTVLKESQFKLLKSKLKAVSLVITDASIYREVEAELPKAIRLTSFSILFSRKKGELGYFVDSVKRLNSLKDGDKILICESCSHNTTHEDIGRVKIPNGIKKYTGKDLKFEYGYGETLPEDLSAYSLIVHCGACMSKKNILKRRIIRAKEQAVPMTNYGVLFAYISGTLDRAINFL